MNELPEGWTLTKFMDVFDIQGGTQPPKSTFQYEPQPGYIQLLQIRDFGEHPVPTYIRDTDTLKKCTEQDILVARYGASLGRILTGLSGAYNVAMAKVDIPEAIDRRFVYHLLRSEIFQAPLRLVSRSAQNGFNKQDIAEIELPLAPLNEQKRIADKLDALLKQVDACRVRLNRIPLILKRFRQALLAAAISGQLTKDWRVVTESESNMQFASLSEALSELKTGPFGSVLHQSDYITGGIPIVNPMHINSGKITPSDEMTVSPEKAEELLDFMLKPGDVVIARRGVMGRCAVVQPEQEGWICGTGSMILRSQSHLSPKYLQIFLSCPDTVEILKAEAVGTTMINLNQQVLLSLELWLPTLAEQQEIVHRIEHFFAYADRLEARHQSACALIELLIPMLLAKAFRGELVPQDPNDEPVSSLLERIRTDRAAQPSKANRAMTSRKTAITKMTKESVKEAIRQLPKDKFSFDELRENLTGDYDSIKDILFTLLSEAEPILTQVFDQEERAIRFFRAGK